MGRMTGLQQLAVRIPDLHTAVFEREFRKAELLFPMVRKLEVGSRCDFMLELCPDVKEIKIWRVLDGKEDRELQMMTGAEDISMMLVTVRGGCYWTSSFNQGEWPVPPLLDPRCGSCVLIAYSFHAHPLHDAGISKHPDK